MDYFMLTQEKTFSS
jgi:solute carrier family 8 (sodium/calcium exchanger)